MSDSSSSEDEDGSRYRAACDPTLSTVFDIKGNINVRVPVPAAPAKEESENGDSDNRASFQLLRNIRSSMAALQTTNSGHLSVQADDREGFSLRTKILPSDSPSTLSPFLAKHLSTILDQKVELTIEPQDDHSTQVKETNKGQPSLCLLRGVRFEPVEEEDIKGAQRKRRKAAAKARKKNEYFDSSDEEGVKCKCKSLAVSPDWLLHNTHLPPPHPKNTRYLDEYVVRERRKNGVIIAHALDASGDSGLEDFWEESCSELKRQDNKNIKRDFEQSPKKKNKKKKIIASDLCFKNAELKKPHKICKLILPSCNVEHLDITQINEKLSSEKKNAHKKKTVESSCVKGRKQSRKRGKRRPKITEINTEPE